MWLTRFSFAMVVGIAFSVLSGAVTGQVFQPFYNSCGADYDFRMFEPLNGYCPDEPQPNTGFFFTYDKLATNISRPMKAAGEIVPELSTITPPDGGGGLLGFDDLDYFMLDITLGEQDIRGGHESGDWTTGTRYNFGYMTEENHGWLASISHIRSPGAFAFTDQTDRNFPAPGEVNRLGDAGVNRAFDRLETLGPIGPLRSTFNDTEINSFELNKVWRLEPLHNGVILEPYLGPRYVKVKDRFRVDRVEQAIVPRVGSYSFGAAGGLAFDSFVGESADLIGIRRIFETNRNHLFGGQLGIRTSLRRGRWIIGADVRAIAFHNYDVYHRGEHFEASADTLGVVGAVDVDQTTGTATATVTFSENNDDVVLVETSHHLAEDRSDFVWGGELRGDVAFELTRDISIRAGVEISEYVEGLFRGQGGFGDNALTAMGFTLGMTLNR